MLDASEWSEHSTRRDESHKWGGLCFDGSSVCQFGTAEWWFVSLLTRYDGSSVCLEYQAFYFICFVKTFCGNISDVRWLPPLQVARSKLVSVVGVNPPSDIASGRIAEMRKRNMSCFAWRASRSKNAEAFLNLSCITKCLDWYVNIIYIIFILFNIFIENI